MRTLALTNPYQHGPDVVELQKALVAKGYRIRTDGEYGKNTAAAVVDAKRRLGYRKKGWPIEPVAGDRFRAALAAHKGLLVKETTHKKNVRQKIVDYCLWGIAHEPKIHYSQDRPMEMANLYGLPQSMDCSEFATKAYKSAGAPDPNGNRFNGSGYTGDMKEHGVRVPLEHGKPADLVIYGAFGGHHVAVLLQAGSANGGNPWLCSHGREAGPVKVTYKNEDAVQAPPTQVRSYLGD